MEEKPRTKRPLLKVLVVSMAIILVLGGSVIFYISTHARNTKTADLKTAFTKYSSSLAFPVIYPAKLPDKFYVTEDEIKNTNGIITFSIQYYPKKQAAVTVQEIPQDFDTGTLSGNQEFTTPLGKAYIVDTDTRTTGSLVTEKAWVIINAPEKMGTEDLKYILNNLSYL
jgi:hypothetical protein